MSRCDHSVVPGRKPGTERCTKCSWRFPCAGNDCGHLDCIEFRQQLPLCHYCRKRVEGSPGGFSLLNSFYPPIRQMGGQDASWTIWDVRGVTRSVHYACRNERASPAELARWGEL